MLTHSLFPASTHIEKYIFVVVLNFMLIGLVTLIAPSFLLDYMKFQEIPFDFRLMIFFVSLGNFVFCFLWEKYFLDHVLRRAIERLKASLKIRSAKRFKGIDEEMKADNWPFNNIISNNRDTTSKESQSQVQHRWSRCASEERLQSKDH